MTRIQRIENFAVALILLFFAFVLMIVPDYGYLIVFCIVSLSWLIQSIRLLAYYFTMARFMVGGRRILLKGVIFFNLAIMILSLSDIPQIYVMLYLVLGMLFANVIDIFRALDAKRCANKHWKYKMITGIAGFILAIICLVNYKIPNLAGYIYAIELVYSAIIRIINAFRHTEIVYVQ